MIATDPPRPYNSAELDALREVLRSALISDILDRLGRSKQCLEPGIAPLDPDLVLVGYAFTTLATQVDGPPETAYVGLLEALDAVGADEVWMVASASDAALWGELTSTAVRAAGARGTVCDGYIRDTRMIRQLGYPVFSRGTSPLDAHGRVEITVHDGPVRVGGVEVNNGDLVVGDQDGIAVIPRELVREVVDAAVEKATSESEFRKAVGEGMKPSDAYNRFHVL